MLVYLVGCKVPDISAVLIYYLDIMRWRLRNQTSWVRIPDTAFIEQLGHYVSMALPFELTNAPATFQSLMTGSTLAELCDFCLVHLDDKLIVSKDKDDHEKHLRLVLDDLEEHMLIARLCNFAV